MKSLMFAALMSIACMAHAEELPRPGSFDMGPFKMDGQLNGTPCNIRVALAAKKDIEWIPNFYQVIFDKDTFGHVSGFGNVFDSDGTVLQINSEGKSQQILNLTDTEDGHDSRLILDFNADGSLKNAQYQRKTFLSGYKTQFACGNLGKPQRTPDAR